MTGAAGELDLRMMDRAIALARAAEALGEVPIGAVVYDPADGRTLGEGFNRRETDARPTAHAEILAIEAAAATLGDWRLDGLALAVTLEPCPMCAGAIVNSRIRRVVFGPPDPKAGASCTLMNLLEDPRLNHRVTEVIAGVRADECGALLRGFFRRLRAGATTPDLRTGGE